MSSPRIITLTTLAMIAFASNSLFCRGALRDTGIDAASFTTIRLLSGALMLGLLVRIKRGAPAGKGNWPSALALFVYAAAFSFAYVSLPAATGALLAFGSVQATIFYQFVQPALQRMMGLPSAKPLYLQLTCVSDLRKAPGRVEFQRGIMETDDNGTLVVRSTGMQGSGMLNSMGKANCFIILPMETARVEAGSEVTVQPFAGLV